MNILRISLCPIGASNFANGKSMTRYWLTALTFYRLFAKLEIRHMMIAYGKKTELIDLRNSMREDALR
jgi:hypothetical protein